MSRASISTPSCTTLQPGQMLHWPLNGPHRIVNADCVNVSLATEHFTPWIRRSFHVNYANGVLRRQGWTDLSQTISGPSYWIKLGLAAAYKLSGMHAKHKRIAKVDFAVDPNSPDGIQSIAGYAFRPGSNIEEKLAATVPAGANVAAMVNDRHSRSSG